MGAFLQLAVTDCFLILAFLIKVSSWGAYVFKIL